MSMLMHRLSALTPLHDLPPAHLLVIVSCDLSSERFDAGRAGQVANQAPAGSRSMASL